MNLDKAFFYIKRYAYYPAAYVYEVGKRTIQYFHARYTVPLIGILSWPFKKIFSLIFNRYTAGLLLVAVSVLAAIWHFDKGHWHEWADKLLEHLSGHLSTILQKMGELTVTLPSLENYMEIFSSLQEFIKATLDAIPGACSKVFNNLKNWEIASNIAVLTAAFSVGRAISDATAEEITWKIIENSFEFCRLTAGTLFGWAIADAAVLIFPTLMPAAPVLLPATALTGFGMAHMLPIANLSLGEDHENWVTTLHSDLQREQEEFCSR